MPSGISPKSFSVTVDPDTATVDTSIDVLLVRKSSGPAEPCWTDSDSLTYTVPELSIVTERTVGAVVSRVFLTALPKLGKGLGRDIEILLCRPRCCYRPAGRSQNQTCLQDRPSVMILPDNVMLSMEGAGEMPDIVNPAVSRLFRTSSDMVMMMVSSSPVSMETTDGATLGLIIGGARPIRMFLS